MEFNAFTEQLKQVLQAPPPGPEYQYRMAAKERPREAEVRRYHQQARKCSVLVLFYPMGDIPHTVFIQRPVYKGVHSGQIAFPGGRKEEEDPDLIATALREANEEVGVQPDDVQIIRPLTDLYIPPSNYLVTPVVGIAHQRPNFVLEEKEVAGIIEADIHLLMDETIQGVKEIEVAGGFRLNSPYFDVHGNTIWGATAMMMAELNEVLHRTRSALQEG